MRAGRLSVHVQGVALNANPDEPLRFEAELPGVGKVSSGPSSDLRWEQGLTLELNPASSSTLQVSLSTLSGLVVARGSTSLDWTDADKQELRLPLEGAGGEVDLILRYFHCRTPGKGRDGLGRELLDGDLFREPSLSGHLSPVSSPRAGLEANRVPLRPRRGLPEATCA
ncbi:hypothetical protein ACKKBG_A17045 [Auxenochlorella protothecoides x Auxenochlorella symbiontica]|uniref:C2 domain-containing protein n=2 Tax=Auxenochlorella protothecoides TaxID=3075 RepID=A0A087SFK0_AUXPR|nr:hypothetical protein F751_3222 [Auxenochlorella protothecoides]KFM24504.1 hypothetical protein F751_3222 [Auxenochlorella protothecoides]RMZ54444.1 hypothetical protein APUTEX25_002020 [Auxenochlorella protothecoides]|eukprot:RMZ54444.1 hypothetical protein APUTEX25_002020 [Auxenochlorella protothecoides]